jgi:cytochrome c-type biogenesis protein CcmH
MKWFNQFFSLLALCAAILFSSVNAADEMLTFDNDDLRDRYSELTFQLRCPKCQNQNVADSNAPISLDIRQKTYEMLHQGYSDQDIIDFMVERYTEFVIYKPQLSIVTIWLWIVPFSILLIGGVILIQMTRRKATASDIELSDEESERLSELLKEKS